MWTAFIQIKPIADQWTVFFVQKILINVFILLGSVLQSYERKKGTFILCNPNHYLLSFLMVSYTSLYLWFVVNINEWKCSCLFLSLQSLHIDCFALDFDKFLMVVRMRILWIFTVFKKFLSVKIIRRVWTIDLLKQGQSGVIWFMRRYIQCTLEGEFPRFVLFYHNLVLS